MSFPAYFAYAGAALLLLEFFHFCRQRKLYDKRTKLFLAMFVAALLICLGSISLTIHIRTGRAASALNILLADAMYLAQFVMPYFVLYMSCLTAQKPRHPLLKIGAVIFVCGSLVILSNPWSHVIAYPETDRLWHIGTGYSVFGWGIFVLYLLDFCIVLYQKKNMKHQQASALAETCLIMVAGMLLQNIFQVHLMVGFFSALATEVIYLSMQNPYAYMEVTTGVFRAEYFEYYIWECFSCEKEVFLLMIKLSGLDRIHRLYGTDAKVSRKVAEKLWGIAPGHRVFHVQFDKYVILSNSREEHERTLIQVQSMLSKEMELSRYTMKCPVILISLPHGDAVCHGSISEMMNYVRFLQRQTKQQDTVQLIEGSSQQQKRFLYEQVVEQHLHDAIENDSFEVWYQPIYSVQKQRFVGVEALSRLYDPELGWISPELFIRLAVKSGDIYTLMPMQLHKICQFLQAHALELSDMETVKINLSPAELVKDGYCEQLIEIIRSYGLPMRQFLFEVTETDATEYTKELEQCIRILQQNRIQLCLDDFGSGYANLNNIFQLPFSVIKMDRSLLQGICENEKRATFYHSMVNTLHDIGYQIVSEGVETEREAKLLIDWKVDMIQGYYYAKPLSAEEVVSVWKKKRSL